MTEYLQRMARYNRWVNRRLFAKVSELPDDAITKDRDAYFASILGTLNHIMVGDVFWLHRFAAHASHRHSLKELHQFRAPASLRDILYDDFSKLTSARERLDTLILHFSKTWTPELLAQPIQYRNTAKEKEARTLESLLQHFFNHQTHHRGQTTHMLFDAGIDPGVTDLLVMMEESR